MSISVTQPFLRRHAVRQSFVAFMEYFTAKPIKLWKLVVEIAGNCISVVFKLQIVIFKPLVVIFKPLVDIFDDSAPLGGWSRGIFEQTIGITTGLICGSQLANLFLHGMDMLWKAFASEQQFSLNITASHLYKRYIDDVLIGHHPTISPSQIADLLNSFHADIGVRHDSGGDDGQGLNFLDLRIQQLQSHDGVHL